LVYEEDDGRERKDADTTCEQKIAEEINKSARFSVDFIGRKYQFFNLGKLKIQPIFYHLFDNFSNLYFLDFLPNKIYRKASRFINFLGYFLFTSRVGILLFTTIIFFINQPRTRQAKTPTSWYLPHPGPPRQPPHPVTA